MSKKSEEITCFQLSNVTLTCQFLDSTGKGPYLQEAISIHDNGLTVWPQQVTQEVWDVFDDWGTCQGNRAVVSKVTRIASTLT